MKLKTLIIDDEPIALEKLRNYVQRNPSLELVGACHDGIEALPVLSENQIDLIITDINMPDLNGLDLIKSLPYKPMVILSTAYSEYAIDGYKVSAVDYLLKPYGFVDFSNAVNKVLERALPRVESSGASSGDDSLFVKVDYRFVRIGLSEVKYIKGYGEYLQIFVEGKPSPVVTLSSFATIKEKLTPNFVQVHRSYIVNMNHINIIDRNRLIIGDDSEIPIGDSYKADLQQYLADKSTLKQTK